MYINNSHVSLLVIIIRFIIVNANNEIWIRFTSDIFLFDNHNCIKNVFSFFLYQRYGTISQMRFQDRSYVFLHRPIAVASLEKNYR